MVRFTLNCPMAGTGIRMDVPDDEPMNELNETVVEYWGKRNVVFVRGYEILDMDSTFGRVLKDGDEVEAIPDPSKISADSFRGRVQYNDAYGGTWSEGLGLKRTF